MEAIRNYVQHRDLGVHNISLHSGRVPNSDSEYIRYGTSVTLDISIFAEDKKFNKKAISDLNEMDHVPDLMELVRRYISEISTLHSGTREALRESVESSQIEVERCISDYQVACGDDAVLGLSVSKGKGAGLFDVGARVFKEPFELLEQAVRLNHCPLNLGPAFVSSEIIRREKK